MALERDTLAQLLDTVARFVTERLRPLEERVAEEDRIPPEIVAEMRALGLFGLSIPEEYGGLGLTMSEEAQVAFRLGRTSPAFRSLIGTNNGIGSQGIVIDGTPEQKAHWLPRMASGEIVGSFCLTEPEAGSDAGSLKTTARRDGNDAFVINGTKRFITNAPAAGLFTVFARTDPQSTDARGVSAFLVEADAVGITLGAPDRKMGQKGAQTCDVIFEEVRVPADAIIGGPAREGQGFKTAMKVLDRGRLHISAVCVGVAERLIDDALAYAIERKQFGQAIAEFQLVQAMLADSKAEAYAARCMVEETARRKDEGRNVSTEAACAKMFASEMVGRVADRAVQIHGGAGYVADYGVERFYRDVRLFRIYEGTTQIQQLVIARAMIKEVRGGDRVLVVLENSVTAVAALMAASRLDAWAALVNARLAAPELARIRAHCEPRAIVFTTGASGEAARHAADVAATPIDDDRVGAFAIAGHLPATPEPVDESNAAQVAAMIYTSGTTGNPKGVMLTHRNVLFIAVVSGAARALGADDLVYAVLPLSHVFGLASTCLGTINAGGALRLVNRFDPAHLAEALRGGVTVFQGVPAMYARLLEHLDEALVAPRLRYMSAGGAPLDLNWKRRIEARFGRTLNNGYGLTEASPTVAQTRIDDPRDDDSIGPALPGVEIRFVDPDGRDVPEGEVGECWVRGPNVMKGYYRDPEASAATITPDGWLRTGDLGRRGPDHNLFLVGRVKELIIRSGFNVYR